MVHNGDVSGVKQTFDGSAVMLTAGIVQHGHGSIHGACADMLSICCGAVSGGPALHRRAAAKWLEETLAHGDELSRATVSSSPVP